MPESPDPRLLESLGGDTLDAIVREWARVKIQKLDILNYNGANLAYNHAANTANLLKLSDQQKLSVTPFPCPTNINVNSTTRPLPPEPDDEVPAADEATAAATPGKLAAILQSPLGQIVGRALGYGLPAAGLLYAGTLLAGKGQPVPQPPAPIVKSGGQGNVGLEVEGWQQPNKSAPSPTP